MMIFRCVDEEEGGSAVLRGDTLATQWFWAHLKSLASWLNKG